MATNTKTAPADTEKQAEPIKLEATVRPIEPRGKMIGFASVTVHDFRIFSGEKGLFVTPPSVKDESTRSGYRDTARLMGDDIKNQINATVRDAYVAEVEKLQARAAAVLNTHDRRHEREESFAIFENVHEPIIDRQAWETVQRTREGNKRWQPKNNKIKYFNCSNYRGNRGLCNDTHYIRADALEQVMLLELRRMTAFLQDKEESFVNLLMDKSVKEAKSEAKRREKEIISMIGRCRELDELFTKTHEDICCKGRLCVVKISDKNSQNY